MPSAARATAQHPSVVTFITGEDWAVEELGRFISAVETAYGLMLALFWIARESEGVDNRRDGYFIAMELREHLANAHGGGKYDEFEPMFALGSFPAEQAWLLNELRGRLYPRLPKSLGSPGEARLRLLAVRMESPGLISFEGLADCVRELRELIKDFVWRIAHERRMGGLEEKQKQIRVARDYLKFQREYQTSIAPTMPSGIDPATVLIAGVIHELGDLEERGRLKRRPDALDQIPGDVEQ